MASAAFSSLPWSQRFSFAAKRRDERERSGVTSFIFSLFTALTKTLAIDNLSITLTVPFLVRAHKNE